MLHPHDLAVVHQLTVGLHFVAEILAWGRELKHEPQILLDSVQQGLVHIVEEVRVRLDDAHIFLNKCWKADVLLFLFRAVLLRLWLLLILDYLWTVYFQVWFDVRRYLEPVYSTVLQTKRREDSWNIWLQENGWECIACHHSFNIAIPIRVRHTILFKHETNRLRVLTRHHNLVTKFLLPILVRKVGMHFKGRILPCRDVGSKFDKFTCGEASKPNYDQVTSMDVQSPHNLEHMSVQFVE